MWSSGQEDLGGPPKSEQRHHQGAEEGCQEPSAPLGGKEDVWS